MKKADKTAIAKELGTTSVYLDSWLASFVEVRNICAHYGRLYNKLLLSPPKLHNNDKGIVNNRIFSVLYTLRRFNYSEWISSVLRIKAAINRYPAVDLRRIGFPANWESLLFKKRYQKPSFYSYPVIFTYTKESVTLSFRDLKVSTTVSKECDSLFFEAKKLLSNTMIELEQKSVPVIPAPSSVLDVKLNKDEKVFLITTNMGDARSKKRTKSDEVKDKSNHNYSDKR